MVYKMREDAFKLRYLLEKTSLPLLVWGALQWGYLLGWVEMLLASPYVQVLGPIQLSLPLLALLYSYFLFVLLQVLCWWVVGRQWALSAQVRVFRYWGMPLLWQGMLRELWVDRSLPAPLPSLMTLLLVLTTLPLCLLVRFERYHHRCLEGATPYSMHLLGNTLLVTCLGLEERGGGMGVVLGVLLALNIVAANRLEGQVCAEGAEKHTMFLINKIGLLFLLQLTAKMLRPQILNNYFAYPGLLILTVLLGLWLRPRRPLLRTLALIKHEPDLPTTTFVRQAQLLAFQADMVLGVAVKIDETDLLGFLERHQ